MADTETARRLALELADSQENTCYGTPAFYVKRKLFARLLADGDSVVVKIDNGDRARGMSVDPNTFLVTDHYRNYPMMIIRLSRVDDADLRDRFTDAWKYVASDLALRFMAPDSLRLRRSAIGQRYSPAVCHRSASDGRPVGIDVADRGPCLLALRRTGAARCDIMVS